jgi:hypothetical protein
MLHGNITHVANFLRYFFAAVSFDITHRLCKQNAVSFGDVFVLEKITGKDLTPLSNAHYLFSSEALSESKFVYIQLLDEAEQNMVIYQWRADQL